MNKTKNILLLLAWITVFQAVSAGIGLVTAEDITGWYATLVRPDFAPPNFVFPIVWPALYLLIAIAGWRIFCVNRTSIQPLGALFIIYMALNWTWSFIFFSLHMIFAG